MRSDEILNFAKQLLTLASGVAVGIGLLTSDQASELVSYLIIGVPAMIGAGSVVWSVYAHWGMKKVPEAAVALELPKSVPVPPVGAELNLSPLNGKAKVVG